MLRLIAWIWTALSGACLFLAVLFFESSYWRHRDCFNEDGRCLVDGVVFHAQTGIASGLLAALSGLSVLAGFIVLRSTRARAG